MFETGGSGNGQDNPNGEQGSTPQLPEGGHAKFYNPQTGAYNWEAHAREQSWIASQRRDGERGNPDQGRTQASLSTEQALDRVARAALSGKEDLDARIALRQAGIPDSVVASHVNAARVSGERVKEEVVSYAGGKEAVTQMQQWARSNLSETDRAALNHALSGPSWKMAIDWVKGRMGGAMNAGNLNVDQQLGMGGSEGSFSSRADMLAAQRDPRYQTDPAFRQQVFAKVRNSSWFGQPRKPVRLN